MAEENSFVKEFGVIPINHLEPTHELRRAIDLFMVPEGDESVEFFRTDALNPSDFVSGLEDEEFTGVIKFSNKMRMMRGALLLYRGRCVGAVCADKLDPNTKATEDSLSSLLLEMKFAATSVMKYRQRDELVLPYSALFLGYPVERQDDYPTRDYYDYIADFFTQKDSTATLAFSYELRTALVFFYKGDLVGFYDVDDVTFDAGDVRLKRFMERMPQAVLEASILPPEVVAPGVGYGFRMSSYL